MSLLRLSLSFVRLLLDVLSFLLALGRTAYMRAIGRRNPIQNWPRFLLALWWYIRLTRAEARGGKAMLAE